LELAVAKTEEPVATRRAKTNNGDFGTWRNAKVSWRNEQNTKVSEQNAKLSE